jgi:tetratricopeptide (TPR) repeat protein
MAMRFKFVWLWCLLSALSIHAQTSTADSFRNAAEAAAVRGNRRDEAQNLRWLAEHQANMGNAVEALPNARRAIDIFKSLHEEGEAIRASIPLLSIHQQLHNGEKIVEIATSGVQYARAHTDTALLIDMTNSLGIGYDECRQYNKALPCYLDCIALEQAIGLSSAVNHANASSTLVWLGRCEEARQYAVTAYQLAGSAQDTSAMTFAKLNEGLALAYLGRGDELLTVIAQTEALAVNDPDISLPGSIAYLKSLAFAAKRDFAQAYQYHKIFYQIDSAYSSAERNAHFAQLDVLYQTKEKQLENARLSASVAQQRSWLVVVGGLLVLLAALAFFQRKRLIIHKKLIATEKALAETERLRIAEIQRHYESELQDFTRILIEKNLALEQALQVNADPHHLHTVEQNDLQSELRQFSILTDADWRNFREKFERVHSGFFEQFSREVPDATLAELRLAALTKLALSNSEIAAVLGISPESVIKTRYRLRKKLGERELEAVVEQGSAKPVRAEG